MIGGAGAEAREKTSHWLRAGSRVRASTKLLREVEHRWLSRRRRASLEDVGDAAQRSHTAVDGRVSLSCGGAGLEPLVRNLPRRASSVSVEANRLER